MSYTTDVFEQTERIIAENSDYRFTNSLDSALKLSAALTQRISMLPQRQQGGGNANESIMWSHQYLMMLLEKVDRWIAAKQQAQRSRTSKVRFCRYRT